MNKTLVIFGLVLLLLIGNVSPAQAQVAKFVMTDTFYGGATGCLLWGGTALIKESTSNSSLGVSIGVGILLGLGMGIYDATIFSRGGNPYRHGVLQDKATMMQIVAMDGVYGGGTGALVGIAISLISGGKDFGHSLSQGAGYGIYAGVIFGVFDAIVLAKGGMASLQSSDEGLFAIQNVNRPQVGIYLPRPEIKIDRHDFQFDQIHYTYQVKLAQIHF
jgi:hypothetical protein